MVLLRDEVRKFADEMEKELRRHDPEKGDSWKELDIVRLDGLLAKAYLCWGYGPEKNRRDELIDLANIAMMLWHRLGE